ncbi:hypothetical protein FQA39_LY10665 [Lamprigera yunnana]|nr:hypothetical protein FQA39_LY10665 [Lamprigera yunnana]
MNSMTIKEREGVKKIFDKAKSRSVPLHLGVIMTFDTNNRESNMSEAGEESQSTDLPWALLDEYNINDKARLLSCGNASEETMINSTRYDLDNEDKYIEMGYGTHLDLQPVIRIRDGATGYADSRCNACFNKNNKDYQTTDFRNVPAFDVLIPPRVHRRSWPEENRILILQLIVPKKTAGF